MQKPEIVKFDMKGAKPSTPLMKEKVQFLVQHHMAHPTWTIEQVHDYHLNQNGWSGGLGYNFWIAKDGTIYEGRGFTVGAHVGGKNSISIGIGYQGDLQKQELTSEQLLAGARLNAWLLEHLNLNLNAIVGHRDLAATSCPGANFSMDKLKEQVKELLAK